MTNPVVTSLIERLERGDDFSGEAILKLNRAEIAPELAAALEAAPPERRRKLDRRGLQLLSDLGRAIIPADESGPERFAPIVTKPAVVAYTVCLLESADPDARDEAGALLGDQVPSPLLRPNAQTIFAAIRKYPGSSGGALILGRIGTKLARELLESVEPLQLTSPDDTEIAMARLGDETAQSRVLKAYHSASDPRAKADLALRVGYIASRDAILTLARDFRTPESYVWRMESRRSLRIFIIEGLHRSFLTEPLLWKPFYKPHEDSYYERIEAWITSKMGVLWTQPRPPFLYEEDAPLPPDRH